MRKGGIKQAIKSGVVLLILYIGTTWKIHIAYVTLSQSHENNSIMITGRENEMVSQKNTENASSTPPVTQPLTQPVLSKEEVADYLLQVFPQAGVYNLKIDAISAGKAVVSMETNESHLRPGNTVSGPTIFALADIAFYVLILAHIGKVALAVTTNANINFLNKPKAGKLTAHTTFLKKGKRLIVCDTQIMSGDTLIAHATGTYSVPPVKSE